MTLNNLFSPAELASIIAGTGADHKFVVASEDSGMYVVNRTGAAITILNDYGQIAAHIPAFAVCTLPLETRTSDVEAQVLPTEPVLGSSDYPTSTWMVLYQMSRERLPLSYVPIVLSRTGAVVTATTIQAETGGAPISGAVILHGAGSTVITEAGQTVNITSPKIQSFTFNITFASGVVAANGSLSTLTVVFPVAFASTPFVVCTPSDPSVMVSCTADTVTSSQFRFVLKGTAGATYTGATVAVQCIAIGT